jgi:hypothetical protein
MVYLHNGMTMAQKDLKQLLKMAKKKGMRPAGKRMAMSNLKPYMRMESPQNKNAT